MVKIQIKFFLDWLTAYPGRPGILTGGATVGGGVIIIVGTFSIGLLEKRDESLEKNEERAAWLRADVSWDVSAVYVVEALFLGRFCPLWNVERLGTFLGNAGRLVGTTGVITFVLFVLKNSKETSWSY